MIGESARVVSVVLLSARAAAGKRSTMQQVSSWVRGMATRDRWWNPEQKHARTAGIVRGTMVSSPIRLLSSAVEPFHRRFERVRRDDQARQGLCETSESHTAPQGAER